MANTTTFKQTRNPIRRHTRPLRNRPHRLAAVAFACSAGLFIGAPALAQDKIPEKSGLSGFIGLGAGISNTKSNMFAGSSLSTVTKRTTDSLFSSPNDRTTGSPTFDYDLRYTFASSRTQVLLGTQILDLVRFDPSTGIGVAHELPDESILTARFLFSSLPSKVWSDPYIAGQSRDKTDRKNNGARLTWSGILSSNFTGQLTYRKVDINDEDSGINLGLNATQRKLLDRQGDVYDFNLRYTFDLGNGHTLEPGFVYTDSDLDGRAMKNTQYGGQLNYFYKGSGFHIVANAYLARASYDATNPIYEKTQEDDIYGLGGTYFYHSPFGFKNWSAVFGASWFEGDSNINFYNEGRLGASISALYSF